MISDLNTFLNKAVPDTKLTIKKYLDAKFEYLVSYTMLLLRIQLKLFITSLVITEYSISDINLLGTDLFTLKFTLTSKIAWNNIVIIKRIECIRIKFLRP